MLGHGNKNVITLSLGVEVSLKKENVLQGLHIEAIAIDKAKETTDYSQQSHEIKKKGVVLETSFNYLHQREIKAFIIILLSWKRNVVIIANLLPQNNILLVKDINQLPMLALSILIHIPSQQIMITVLLARVHLLLHLLMRMILTLDILEEQNFQMLRETNHHFNQWINLNIMEALELRTFQMIEKGR